MKENTRYLLIRWLGMFPDSTHPLDEERFFEMVSEICKTDDTVTYADIYNALDIAQSQWTEKKKSQFSEDAELKIDLLVRFAKFQNNRLRAITVLDPKDFEKFLQECGELDYHEIYELATIAEQNYDASDAFDIHIDNQNIEISYSITGASIKMPVVRLNGFKNWIEENIMDNMDAESWYGFQCALEKSMDE